MLAGLALVFAAASPLKGVSPRGGSGGPAAAEQEMSVLAAGEFEIKPLGKVMKPTPYPASGVRGGPTLAVKVTNITPIPLRLSVRLTQSAATLDDAVRVRASAAGAVVLNTTLGKALEWSKPAGLLESGQSTTLRLRLKLLPGLSPDRYLGRLDSRQLEVKGIKLNGRAATHTVVTQIPDPTSPQASSPAAAAAPRATTAPAASTPQAAKAEPNGPAVQSAMIPVGENPKIEGVK